MACHLCGTYPKWLGFDGVSLALSKDKVLWDTVETIFPKDGSTEPCGNTLKKQKERMLLSNTNTRQLLSTFCNSKPASLNCNQFSELCKALDEECPSLAALLRVLHQEEVKQTDPIPVYNFSFAGHWKEFFLILSSTTSAAWILRPTIIPLILHLTATKIYTPDAHKTLAEFCPPLAYALSYLPKSILPEPVVDLLLAMVNVVQTTHPGIPFAPAPPTLASYIPTSISNEPKNQDHLQTIPQQQTWLTHLKEAVHKVQKAHVPLSIGYDHETLSRKYPPVPELDSSLSGMYYPNWPRIRKLPRLEGIDPLPATRGPEWNDPQESTTETELFCIKDETRSYESQKHTAGMFVASCLHGVCYGFHHMVQPEGRKDLMKVAYERFPKEVLDSLHILYDFNCQAGEYMYNRYPDLFSHTRLFIDRWHAASHKCAAVFKLQAYPVFQELVSTGPEALNRFLQYMHGQAPFMRQETQMALLKATTGVRNKLINEELKRLQKEFQSM
jgi:hypothetical protein